MTVRVVFVGFFAAYGKGKGHGDRACHIAEIIDGVGLHGNAAADYAYYKLANGKDKIENCAGYAGYDSFFGSVHINFVIFPLCYTYF